MEENRRPNPDMLLAQIKREEMSKNRGAFRVFFGMCPGVGKTYAMLRAAQEQHKLGKNIVVGIVETHGRVETERMLTGLQSIPMKVLSHRGTLIKEMDIDTILRIRPDIVLVDELAHTNAPGSRHNKRYQDVLELIENGISVFTTLNVQHIESRADIVQQITGVQVRETVPDSIWELADQIELIDISPQELLKRLKEGKVYLGERAARAEENFFKEAYLVALREISLRFTAEKVDHDLRGHISIKQLMTPWNTNERLMVAVGHSPSSAKLIRAARRMAFNLEAPWIAVHIDNDVRLNTFDQETLFQNMTLARELGAEIVTRRENNVISALNTIALEKNVTQIVIGRPEKGKVHKLLEELINQMTNVDLHIIRQEEDTLEWRTNRKKTLLKQFAGKGPVPYTNVFYFLAALTFFSFLLNPVIGYRSVGYLYLMGVIIVGFSSTLGPILFASFSGAVLWNYFFIPPSMTFLIGNTEDIMMCVSFILVGTLSGYLARKSKNREQLLSQRDRETRTILKLLEGFSHALTIKEICDLTDVTFQQMFNSQVKILLMTEDGILSKKSTTSGHVSEKEYALAVWSFENKRIAGWATNTLMDSKCRSIPLVVTGRIIGVLLFYPAMKSLSPGDEALINNIILQLGNAIEHIALQKQNQNIHLLEESEKLHQTLLNSVSHEMRIPLTSIMGTVNALQDSKVMEDPEKVKSLNHELLHSSERLNRVIENLLDMTRLNSGFLSLKEEWIEVMDLLQTTISHLKNNDHQIIVEELSENLFLLCDWKLVEHALTNLLLNAIVYSPVGTTIKVQLEQEEERRIFIRIIDEGNGIPEDKIQTIFEKFYRLPGSPTGGVGLGLSIVKGIMDAHGGLVFAGNRRDKSGAIFTLEFPWKPMPGKI